MLEIAYIGNFIPSHSTENHVKRTLQSMGHTVIRLQENQFDSLTLERTLVAMRPDLVLYTRTWGVQGMQKDFFKKLKDEHGIPSASYHLDIYMGISREAGIGNDPFWNTNYVFTVDGDPISAKKFRALGINHFWERAGIVADEAYIAQPDLERFPQEVIFVGSYGYHPEWPHRPQLIDFLRKTYGERFGKHGNPEDTIRESDLNILYASAKVIVGDSLTPGFTHQCYWSDRVYETTGRGGFLIHPRITGLEREFQDGVHLRLYEYGDFDGLKRLIDYYLAPENDQERREIQKQGQHFTRENCTYNIRLQDILYTIAQYEPKIQEKMK